MSNKTAIEELLSVIDGVLEYSHNPLLQQILDAGKVLLEKEKEQILQAHENGFYSPPFRKSRRGEAEEYYNNTYKK